MKSRFQILIIFTAFAIGGIAQPSWNDCDNMIYAAREMYNHGELHEIIQLLEPCIGSEDLRIEQKRKLYRLLAETHLFLRDYENASTYARDLSEIDPKLLVFGPSRLYDTRNKLVPAIQSSQYVDAPDLMMLIRNIRYRAIGIEVFGGMSAELLNVKEERRGNGVTDVFDEEWSEARRTAFGTGIKYDPYIFPLTMSFRVSKSDVTFNYRDAQQVDGVGATMAYQEKQDWISPEFWFGYQFATRTFPVKSIDISLRAGIAADILIGTVLEGALLDRDDGVDWYGGQERDITSLIPNKIYPALLGAVAIDYRVGTPSIFLELHYRHPLMNKYVYDISEAPYASSVRSVQSIGLQAGVRYVFYRAFYK